MKRLKKTRPSCQETLLAALPGGCVTSKMSGANVWSTGPVRGRSSALLSCWEACTQTAAVSLEGLHWPDYGQYKRVKMSQCPFIYSANWQHIKCLVDVYQAGRFSLYSETVQTDFPHLARSWIETHDKLSHIHILSREITAYWSWRDNFAYFLPAQHKGHAKYVSHKYGGSKSGLSVKRQSS